MVRRAAGADDGRGIPGRSVRRAGRDHASAANLRRIAVRRDACRGVTRAIAGLAVVFAVANAAPAFGQGDIVDGHVSFMMDALPDPDARPGRQAVTEVRARLFAERRDEFGSHLRLVLSGHVDGLLVRTRAGSDAAHDAIVRPLDMY